MSIIRVYTDGACSGNPGYGGWSVVIAYPKGIGVISGHDKKATNNMMELKAVVKALAEIKSSGLKGDTFEIRSDSAYVINSIEKGWLEKWIRNEWKTEKGGDVKNKDLWHSFHSLLKQVKEQGIGISFKKVKGHAGDALNEKADSVAREEALTAKYWC